MNDQRLCECPECGRVWFSRSLYPYCQQCGVRAEKKKIGMSHAEACEWNEKRRIEEEKKKLESMRKLQLENKELSQKYLSDREELFEKYFSLIQTPADFFQEAMNLSERDINKLRQIVAEWDKINKK
ncbi:MAG: hypothetical protein WC414_02900 [Patescibacteria group bacterium]